MRSCDRMGPALAPPLVWSGHHLVWSSFECPCAPAGHRQDRFIALPCRSGVQLRLLTEEHTLMNHLGVPSLPTSALQLLIQRFAQRTAQGRVRGSALQMPSRFLVHHRPQIPSQVLELRRTEGSP